MVRGPPVARDKFADPLPRGQILNKWSITSNVTPTPLYTSTATPMPKLPKSSPLLLRRHRWRRNWSASWRRLLHIFTTILMMVMVIHCHLRVQITNGIKFALHLLVITEIAQCSVATRLSPTSTEEKLTGTARGADRVSFAQNTVTCYSKSQNTQKPQNIITLYQRLAATILHQTQQTFRYSDLQLNNVPPTWAAASIQSRN